MKRLLIAVTLSSPVVFFAQDTTQNTAFELRRLQNEVRSLRQQQEMEGLQIAAELRKMREIEEEKLREEQRLQKEAERAERERKLQEYYAKLQQTATSLEAQVGQGEPLSVDQLEWIRGVGMDLKAQLESPNTLMLIEMIRETEQGFTGVDGTLPLTKAELASAKQLVQRDRLLFQRFAAINRVNSELTGSQDAPAPVSVQEAEPIVPAPVSPQLRSTMPATNAVEARRRALMQQMKR